MHPLPRLLSQLLEVLVLDLKQSPDVESGGEPAYEFGPTLSSGERYFTTVILYQVDAKIATPDQRYWASQTPSPTVQAPLAHNTEGQNVSTGYWEWRN